MPATKKAGGRGKKKLTKVMKERLLLDSGQYSMGSVLVIVEEAKKKEAYGEVRAMRALQDVEWYTPDGTNLRIEFVGKAKPKGLKTVRLSPKHVRLSRNEHAKYPTPPNDKGVVVEYVIHVRFKSGPTTIDPYLIFQP